jgi:GNAT superfamily N-acetyltransferase
MNIPNNSTCEFLSWDSEFFGFPIGRICGDSLDDKLLKEADKWSNANKIRCLYCLLRPDNPAALQAAEKHSFNLVDIRVTFTRTFDVSLPTAYPRLVPNGQIRPVEPSDIPQLQVLARTAHSDTRFFNDPHFSYGMAEELYETWIALESQGRAQKVLVAISEKGAPIGYISCHVDSAKRVGRIELVGVAAESRGKGVGKSLVLAALDWLSQQGLVRSTVVTQGRNIMAQRLYQRCGFVTENLQLWYHKWYPEARE